MLESYGVDSKLIHLLKDINYNAEAAVRVCGELGSWFGINRGTRQGDPISPCVFITHLERAIDSIKNEDAGISIYGMSLNNLRFDIDLIDTDEQHLEETVQTLNN